MRHTDRLDRAIDERRLALGLSWKQLAQRAGISDVSLRNFRKGRSEPGPLSKHRLEDALQWTAGSIDAVLAGGEPTSQVDDTPQRFDTESMRDILERLSELQRRVERMERRSG